jgi:hypothetical protein
MSTHGHEQNGRVSPQPSHKSGLGFTSSSLQSAQATQTNVTRLPFGVRGRQTDQPDPSPQLSQSVIL